MEVTSVIVVGYTCNMGITNEQFERLQQNVKDKSVPVRAPVQQRARGRVGKAAERREMNKTERRYHDHLEEEQRAGRIAGFKFESIKLRLADNTSITIDFMVIGIDGFIEFHDTKALWKSTGKPGVKEDAQIKMKIAAEQFPWFYFLIVWEEHGIWKSRMY
jgi:hypothetical protein